MKCRCCAPRSPAAEYAAWLRRMAEDEGNLVAKERRERIASAVMSGVVASPPKFLMDGSWSEFARVSVCLADALIAELDRA